MTPDEANSQVLAHLFAMPPDEKNQTPPCEPLAGVEDSLQGQIDNLLSLVEKHPATPTDASRGISHGRVAAVLGTPK